MPAQPTITFAELDEILEECKEFIPYRMYNAIRVVTNDACINQDDAMIPAICWMVLQIRLGIKSINEIIVLFNMKAEITQSQHYGQYQATMNAIRGIQWNEEQPNAVG
jgi:hypothetical protein